VADHGKLEGLDEAIRLGVEEVRYRNGLALAGLRIGLRTVTLALWLGSLVWVIPAAERRPYWSPVIVNTAHLAIGGWVLAWLLRRRRVRLVLAVAACVDVLVVVFAGWISGPGDQVGVGFLMGVMELMLLFAAFTLPRWQVLALGGLITIWELVVAVRAGFRPDMVGAVVVVTATFAVAVTWAGTRVAELASRWALDQYTGRLVQLHADELAQANREIAAQRDQVLAAQAEAEMLTRLVVHDLKNPIAALLQFASLALSRVGKIEVASASGAAELEVVSEDLRLAVGEGQRLADMVGDLLLISRLESAAVRPVRQPTPVRALLEQVAHGAHLRAEDRKVMLAVRAPSELLATVDLDLVRRLLENLVNHALRSVDRAGRLELAAEADDTRLILAVRNTGPPVPAELRPQLFEKHGRGDRHPLRSGLGLYLCRLVAEAHGGSMALVDAPGWSAAFEARLPLQG